jgi:hypothetical protein
MKLLNWNVKRGLSILAIAGLLLLSPFTVLAAGTTEPVGPQQPVGVQQPVGPQSPVGTVGVVGHVDTPPAAPAAAPATTETAPVSVAPASDNSTQSPTTATLDNSNTGSNSDNSNSVNNTASSTTVNVDNNANIQNNNDVGINTGNNNVGSSTVVGNINTGSADGVLNVLNVGNSQLADGSTVSSTTLAGGNGSVDLTNPNQGIDIVSANNTTGAGSANANQVAGSNVVEVFQQNTANVTNDINLSADTGRNTIDGNTKIGDLTTGDVNLGVNLVNLLNVYRPDLQLSLDLWNVMGDLNGDLLFDDSLANQNTGSNSSNTNQVTNTSNVTVNADNNANINNNLDVTTNTGDNQLSANTMAGNIATGDSTVRSSLSNLANLASPMFYLLNVFGTWDGDLQGLDPNRVIVNVINDVTGSGSDNSNNVAEAGDTTLNLDNDASVSNNVNINANTGHNQLQHNTIVGDIKTGSINISSNVVNVLNSMGADLHNLRLGIINIFGNWHGNGKTKSSEEQHPVTPPVGGCTGSCGSVPSTPPVVASSGGTTPTPKTPQKAVLGVQATNPPAQVAAATPTQEVLGVSATNPNSGLPTKVYLAIIVAIISLILITISAIRGVRRGI